MTRRARLRRALADFVYRLRTEGASPGRQAAAVGVGAFIGCTPFYGLHLALCVVAAKLLRLNQVTTYLAAHVSLPLVWPLLVLAELQVGRWLRGAPPLALRVEDIKRLDLGGFAVDLLAGSALVGAVVAAALAALTWRVALRYARHPFVESLVDEASRRYLEHGLLDWELVRGKLRHDPLYFGLLGRGVLPDGGRLLDLGCGRGILFALLTAARERAARGEWPADRPTPPRGLLLHGIEGRPKTAEAARRALGEAAVIETADLAEVDTLPPARAVLLLDVLHYLPAAAQEELLAKAAATVEPGGALLIRDADAAGGARFKATRLQERLSALARGHWRQRFHYRSAAEWRAILERHGLCTASEGLSDGTPYANVLIVGRRRES